MNTNDYWSMVEEVERLTEENRLLRHNLANLNNSLRHRFDEKVTAALDELFSAMSYRKMTK